MTLDIATRGRPGRPTLTALAHAVVLSWGWRRAVIAFVAGAAGALAMAPVDVFAALVIPMTVAVWLIDGTAQGSGEGAARAGGAWLARLWAAATAGWWWGFGYFVAGLWWIGAAFLVEPDKFAWALPLGVLALPAGLALFPAAGFVLARILWSPGWGRVLALAAGLGASEWLRGHLLTGFPWNAYGMALGGNLVLAQIASVIGVQGLTFLAVALFATPATLADRSGGDRRRAIVNAPVLGAIVALVAIAAWGGARLAAGKAEAVPGISLRIVQPNVANDATFSAANREEIVRGYLRLSDQATSPATAGLADVTHLFWPESAFPFLLSRDARMLSMIAAALPAHTTLVTGAARAEDGPGGGEDGRRYYNSVQVVDSTGAIVGTYDKVHLVPFGEFMPLRRLFARLGVGQFVHVPGGFDAGASRRPLVVPGLPPTAVAICYEAIFPGEIAASGKTGAARAGLILNVTDDGWFGRTAGPWQHLEQARLRTIEEGLPMIRAANTGISAIIDPYGRVLRQLPLGESGVLDGTLPRALDAPPAVRFGDQLNLILWTCLTIGSLMFKRAN